MCLNEEMNFSEEVVTALSVFQVCRVTEHAPGARGGKAGRAGATPPAFPSLSLPPSLSFPPPHLVIRVPGPGGLAPLDAWPGPAEDALFRFFRGNKEGERDREGERNGQSSQRAGTKGKNRVAVFFLCLQASTGLYLE